MGASPGTVAVPGALDLNDKRAERNRTPRSESPTDQSTEPIRVSRDTSPRKTPNRKILAVFYREVLLEIDGPAKGQSLGHGNIQCLAGEIAGLLGVLRGRAAFAAAWTVSQDSRFVNGIFHVSQR